MRAQQASLRSTVGMLVFLNFSLTFLTPWTRAEAAATLTAMVWSSPASTQPVTEQNVSIDNF